MIVFLVTLAIALVYLRFAGRALFGEKP
jgi:hypothetical protein